MKSIAKFLVMGGAIALSGVVWAQQNNNVPMSDPSSSQYNTVYMPTVVNGAQPTQPQERWATRWGAIATDAVNAKLGAVTDMPSEARAKASALQACRNDGGTNCSVDISYYNQCAVLVTGDTMYSTARGPTIEEATRLGSAKCEEKDVNCRVYYSACSLPARVR